MSEENNEVCDNCKFWEPMRTEPLSGETGWCRRYPPTPSVITAIISVVPLKNNIEMLEQSAYHNEPMMFDFPATWNTHWCGEWSAKPPEIEHKDADK